MIPKVDSATNYLSKNVYFNICHGKHSKVTARGVSWGGGYGSLKGHQKKKEKGKEGKEKKREGEKRKKKIKHDK